MTVQIPKKDTYRIWARTRNWLRPHNPGRFTVQVDGRDTGNELGALPSDKWLWEIAGDVTLDVVSTKTTTVEDQSFVTEAIQVVTYEGVGTDAPKMYLQETMPFWEYDDELNWECTDLQYTEAYAAGTLYIELEDKARLSASMDAEGMANRYVPAVLLDSALYGDIGAEETGDVITLTFAAPTAAEIWAVPAEAELVEATGTATVTAGSLTAMTYTVTYDYGTGSVLPYTGSYKLFVLLQAGFYIPHHSSELYSRILHPDIRYSFESLCHFGYQNLLGKGQQANHIFSSRPSAILPP